MTTVEEVASVWHIDLSELEGVTVIVYDYTYEDYSGSAYGLFQRADGTLFEVHGGHCSCYGLEDQWSPEDVTVEFLRSRYEDRPAYVSSAYGRVSWRVREWLDQNYPEPNAGGTEAGEAVFANIVNHLT